MSLDPLLLEILACPEDKGPLLYFEDEDSLYNPRLHRRYAIRDDIPIMLIDEADDRRRGRARPAPGQGGRGRHRAELLGPERRTPDVTAGSGSLAATLDQPELVGRAADATRGQLAEAGERLPGHDDIEHVVVLGMGTSARAGDVALVVAGPLMAVPVVVHRGFALPNFVDRHTLVLAVSGSGDTAETLETAGLAARGRSHRGGRDRRAATWASWPRPATWWWWAMPASWAVPARRSGRPGRARLAGARAGRPVPRRLGLDRGGRRSAGPSPRPAERGRQPGRACWLDGMGRLFPLVYGGGGAGAVAARHWKAQFNLNAKMPAFANEQPEVGHDEVSGWGQSGDVTRQIFRIIDLRHEFEHPQLADRFARTDDLLAEVVAGIDQVDAQGDGVLAQLLDLALYGELVSIHRALQEGIDPGPTPALEAAAR